MIFDLASDFAAALSALPSGHSKRRLITLLDEAIRRDIHFIDRHPTTLFQCMWNSCWWYDCRSTRWLVGCSWAKSGSGVARAVADYECVRAG